MIAIKFEIKRLTWDMFERACLIVGMNAEALFFGSAIGDVADSSLADCAALVALLSTDPVDTGAMTPTDLSECATEVVGSLFRAVSEAQVEAQRYRATLDKKYPYLFKQTAEDPGPPMRVVLSKFSPSDYAEVTQHWTITEIYFWLLALKVQQFDETVRDAIRDFRQTMTN